MDNDSITSDFSIIPENSMNIESADCNTLPLSIDASFTGASQMFSSSSSVIGSDKVVFISTTYSETNGMLTAQYNVPKKLVQKSSDRIALYKSGFAYAEDFLSYVWAPVFKGLQDSTFSSSSFITYSVIFEEKILPKESDDNNKFYVLCYLTHDGDVIGVSSAFEMKQAEEPFVSVEKELMKDQINTLKEENTVISDKNKSLEESLKSLSLSNEELKLANNVLKSQMEMFLTKKECLTYSLARKEAEINELNSLLEDKTQSEAQAKKDIEELQNRIATIVVDMEELKSIPDERLSVLVLDNSKLKTALSEQRQQVELLQTISRESQEGREASEKIASDLSQRLQEAHMEYKNLSLANVSLMRKVKTLKKKLVQVQEAFDNDVVYVPSMNSAIESDFEDTAEKENYNHSIDNEDRAEESTVPKSNDIALPVATAFPANTELLSTSSACSHTTQELSEVVNEKMQTIVKQLTEQIDSLRMQINQKSETESVAGRSRYAEESHDASWNACSNPVLDETATPSGAKFTKVTSGEPNKLIYSDAFLPTQRTAPVFLPVQIPKVSHTRLEPSAPYLSPSASQVARDHSYIATSNSNGLPTTDLPPPLLPETTPTAIQAAVLSQFGGAEQPEPTAHLSSDNIQPSDSYYPQDDVTQHQQVHHESEEEDNQDEEDYHSTGEAEGQATEGPPAFSENFSEPLQCPMCSLVFLPTAIHLLEEHINTHLEHVCPICSQAFPRNNMERYEDHVQSHFDQDKNTMEANRQSASRRDSSIMYNLASLYGTLYNLGRGSRRRHN